MSGLPQLTGSFATIWLLTWLLCLVALAGGYSLLRDSLRRWHPALGANLLLILLACPFLLSLVTTVLLFLPGSDAALVSAHCHDNCQAHAPLIGIPWLAESGLMLILLITFAMIRQLLSNLRAAGRLRTQLALVAEPANGYYLLDDAQPFVFTLGWWRNQIYITRGLLQECQARELVPTQRQMQQQSIASAFTGAEVELRIRALLEAPRASRWQRACLQLSILTLMLVSLGLVDPLHHGVELLIGRH